MSRLRLGETLSLSGKQNYFPREQTLSVYYSVRNDMLIQITLVPGE